MSGAPDVSVFGVRRYLSLTCPCGTFVTNIGAVMVPLRRLEGQYRYDAATGSPSAGRRSSGSIGVDDDIHLARPVDSVDRAVLDVARTADAADQGYPRGRGVQVPQALDGLGVGGHEAGERH